MPRVRFKTLPPPQAGPAAAAGTAATAPGRESPASEQQRFFWFLQQMSPTTAVVNLLVTIEVGLRLDAGEARGALDAVLVRHSTLRSRLVANSEGLVQAPLEPGAVPLSELEARDAAEARARARADARRVFDLEREAPTRCLLFACETGETVLALAMHHVALDEPSLEFLLGDLVAALEDRLGPRPETALEYADYARWQREQYEQGANVGWWADRLAEIELEPTDPSLVRMRRVAVPVDGLVARARAAASRCGVMQGTALVGGFVRTLVSGGGDLLLGLIVTNRLNPDFRELVGPFARMVPFPVRLRADEGTDELIRRLHAEIGAALARQEVPIDRLVNELRRRGIAFQLPNVVFNLVSVDRLPTSLRGHPIRVEAEEIGEEAVHADLVVGVGARDGWRADLDVREGGRYDGMDVSAFVRRWESQY